MVAPAALADLKTIVLESTPSHELAVESQSLRVGKRGAARAFA
jgi:hypothetical protein